MADVRTIREVSQGKKPGNQQKRQAKYIITMEFILKKKPQTNREFVRYERIGKIMKNKLIHAPFECLFLIIDNDDF